MIKRILFLILLTLFTAESCLGFGTATVGVLGSGWPASGEVNMILVGNSTDLSSGVDASPHGADSVMWSIDGTDYIATNSGTLRYGYLRTGASGSATNVKLCLAVLTSGTIYTQVECATVTYASNSLLRATFSGSYNVLSGTHYLGYYVGDGYVITKTGAATWSYMTYGSGSYDTPPQTIDTSSGTNSAEAEIQLYFANY